MTAPHERRSRWLEAQRIDTRGAFWFIWSPDALRPSKQYSSLAAAQADAEKLKALHPEQEFLVYRAELVAEEAATVTQTKPCTRPLPLLKLRRAQT